MSLRFPGLSGKRQIKVPRLSALGNGRLYPSAPVKTPGTLFSQRLSRKQNHILHRTAVKNSGLGYISRCSDWLRAGRSWDRNRCGEEDFLRLSRPVLGPIQPSI
jgi:hypothetical protein